MGLFLSLLPVYLLGNLHCMGMCGPLMLFLGKHRYRLWYLFGRLLSYTLAGFLAGGLGGVLEKSLLSIGPFVSFLFGVGVLCLAGASLFRKPLTLSFLSKLVEKPLLRLARYDLPVSMGLMGAATVLLPCGQTLMVFSACALFADPFLGALNGFLLAFLTSPSLLLSMHLHKIFPKAKRYYHELLGIAGIFIGVFAILRGLAELGVIHHLVISEKYHIVLY